MYSFYLSAKNILSIFAQIFKYKMVHFKFLNFERWAKRLFSYLIIALSASCTLYGVWLFIRIFITDTFTIPTESMLPTLHPGDRIFVNKALMGARLYTDFHFSKEGIELKCFRTKGLRAIKHNDIVAFNMPNKEWQIKFVINYVFCKRCVALPGDSISIVNGLYHNNNCLGDLGNHHQQVALSNMPDSLIPPAAMRTIPFEDHLSVWNIKNFGPLYIPRKGDILEINPKNAALYKILLEYETRQQLDIDWRHNQVLLNGKPFANYTFLHNYYFMAGDNVQNSSDSRYWGLVPEEYIIGIVSYVLKPDML